MNLRRERVRYNARLSATDPAIVKPRNAAAAPPEYQLKHRLAGAVILAGVAALAVGWLLNSAGPDARPAATTTATNTTTTNTTAPPTAQPTESPQPALLTEEADNSDDGEQPALSGEQPAPPPTSTSGWAVRVGTFSKRANIDAVSAKLEKLGFEVHQTAVKTDDGDDAVRIWLGPYASRETAEAVSRRSVAITGEKGFIAKHAP